MELEEVTIAVPEGYQLVVGQSHFIKTIEDIYEALSTSMPGIKFGVAFCEASGKSLVRFDGTDEGSVDLARRAALRVSAGHLFVVVLNGAFPINVLNRLKYVEEVVTLFCATSNQVSVVVAKTTGGRAVLGVSDGTPPKGLETETDKGERKDLLRRIGYKR